MPKDPSRNVDRYKIRGGQLNEFEFHQNQGAVAEFQQDRGPEKGPPSNQGGLPADKAKAARVRNLLAEYGEPASEPEEQVNAASAENQEQESEHNEQNMNNQSSRPENDESFDREATKEDFAPTHGRSPEVIQEMMQRRRATDRVPDPEDIKAGHPEQSEEKKEHGVTGRRTGTRRSDKQTDKNAQTGGKGPQATSKVAKSTGGKEAALDQSKPGTATGASEKKDKKQSASSGRSAKQPAAQKDAKQSADGKSSSGAKGKANGASAKPAAAPKGNGQASRRTGASQTATRKSAASEATNPRQAANGKAASSGTKGAKATTAKASTKQTTGKQPTGKQTAGRNR